MSDGCNRCGNTFDARLLRIEICELAYDELKVVGGILGRKARLCQKCTSQLQSKITTALLPPVKRAKGTDSNETKGDPSGNAT